MSAADAYRDELAAVLRDLAADARWRVDNEPGLTEAQQLANLAMGYAYNHAADIAQVADSPREWVALYNLRGVAS